MSEGLRYNPEPIRLSLMTWWVIGGVSAMVSFWLFSQIPWQVYGFSQSTEYLFYTFPFAMWALMVLGKIVSIVWRSRDE